MWGAVKMAGVGCSKDGWCVGCSMRVSGVWSAAKMTGVWGAVCECLVCGVQRR